MRDIIASREDTQPVFERQHCFPRRDRESREIDKSGEMLKKNENCDENCVKSQSPHLPSPRELSLAGEPTSPLAPQTAADRPHRSSRVAPKRRRLASGDSRRARRRSARCRVLDWRPWCGRGTAPHMPDGLMACKRGFICQAKKITGQKRACALLGLIGFSAFSAREGQSDKWGRARFHKT